MTTPEERIIEKKYDVPGDSVAYTAITNNCGWVWDSLRAISENSDTSRWNTTSWGNLCIAITQGERFPERLEEIKRLKIVIDHLAKVSLAKKNLNL